MPEDIVFSEIIRDIESIKDTIDFKAYLSKLTELFRLYLNCDNCSIWLFDKDSDRLVLRGTCGRHQGWIDKRYYDRGEGLHWYVFETKKSLSLEDSSKHPNWKGKFTPKSWIDRAQSGGPFLGIPVKKEEICYGIITFGYDNIGKSFNEELLRKAEFVAESLSNSLLAIEDRFQTKSLYLFRQDRLSFVKVLSTFRKKLQNCKNINDIYNTTLEEIKLHINCRTISIFLLNDEDILERKYISGFSSNNEPPEEKFEIGSGLTGQVLEVTKTEGISRIENDFQNYALKSEDPRLLSFLSDHEESLFNELNKTEKITHVMVIPIKGQFRTFGVIRVVNKLDDISKSISSKGFSVYDEELLTLISNTISIFIASMRKVHKLDILINVSKLLSDSNGFEPFDDICSLICEISNYFHSCRILILNSYKDVIELKGSYPKSTETITSHVNSDNSSISATHCTLACRQSDINALFKYPHPMPKCEIHNKWIEENQHNSAIIIPIRKNVTEIFGCIAIYVKTKYIFDGYEEAYFRLLADQISSFIERFKYTNRSLILLDIIQKISAEEDLTTNLKVILENTLDAIGAKLGYITLLSLNSPFVKPDVMLGFDKSLFPRLRIGEDGITGWVYTNKLPYLWPSDSTIDENYISYDKSQYIQNEMICPIIFGQEVIGLIVASSLDACHFKYQDLLFLKAVADGSAAIIQNRRFHEAALKLGEIVFHSTDVIDLCNEIAKYAALIMQTPAAWVRLLNKEKNVQLLTIFGSYGLKVEEKYLFDQNENRLGIAWRALKSKSIQVIEDVTKQEIMSVHVEYLQKEGYLSLMCTPLLVGDEAIGVISIFGKRKYSFTNKEVLLLKNFAQSCAIAIRNCKLKKEIDGVHDTIIDHAFIANPGMVALSFSHDARHVMQELNTLVGSLISLVPAKRLENDPGKSVIQGLTEQTDYLRKLFNSLDNYAKSKAEKMSMVLMSKITEFVKYLFKIRMEQANINFNVVYFPKELDQTLRLECYENQIEQLLVNLLNNSIFAIKQRSNIVGDIKINIKILKDEFVEIQVIDNGIGIPEDLKSEIFKPLFTTKGIKGSGFGLPICQRIVVDNHKGKIQIESAINRNTTFNVIIPVKQQGKE